MPTRTQILAATPRCPGKRHPVKGWEECRRALYWRHVHGWWTCPQHGFVEEPDVYEVRAAA